ncbi:MAG: type II toxin-antitoxin system VapC family toxin [Actinomycetota bacterium]
MISTPAGARKTLTVVPDASALVWAVVSPSAAARALRHRLAEQQCHAPHLVDAEVGNVLRRQVLRAHLKPLDAEVLLEAAGHLVDHRYEMTGVLALAAWKLRDNLTFYDALYAALAGALGAPLVTCDHRLANAPGLPSAVELIVTG